MMDFEVVALPCIRRGTVALEDARFHERELVMCRDDAAFPLQVARRKGCFERMALQELAEVRGLLEVLDRDRGNLEAARTLGVVVSFCRLLVLLFVLCAVVV